jgi:hypothetical protein
MQPERHLLALGHETDAVACENDAGTGQPENIEEGHRDP